MKLTIKNIEVPQGMLDAALKAYPYCETDLTRGRVAAALLWLAENPIVPSDEQADQLWHHPKTLHGDEHYAKAMARQWQEIMFLRKPDPVPEEVKAMMISVGFKGASADNAYYHNKMVAEAYKLGLAAKEGK